jgi:hypothetical protein
LGSFVDFITLRLSVRLGGIVLRHRQYHMFVHFGFVPEDPEAFLSFATRRMLS